MMISSRRSPGKALWWIVLPLYLGTIWIGGLMVLLGCMLPSIANLKDTDAGLLLMVQFACSASGALLVRKNFLHTLRIGLCLLPLSALMSLFLPRSVAGLSIAAFGLGQGLAMTSTSMIVGRFFAQRRGAALLFLNFCWSLGATLTPLLIAWRADRLSLHVILWSIVVATVPFILVSCFYSIADESNAQHPTRSFRLSAPHAIVYFALLGFLYVGIETSAGGWMTTYATRLVPWGHYKSNLVTACFWGMLLFGRGITPAALLVVTELKLYLIAIAGALAGLVLLVNAHDALLLIVAASITGLSLAPIFPLILSLFMTVAGESPNSGWVFAMPGFGAALLPWLTGVVSSLGQSLRVGLLVPIVAAFTMLLLALRMRAWLDSTGEGVRVVAELEK